MKTTVLVFALLVGSESFACELAEKMKALHKAANTAAKADGAQNYALSSSAKTEATNHYYTFTFTDKKNQLHGGIITYDEKECSVAGLTTGPLTLVRVQ